MTIDSHDPRAHQDDAGPFDLIGDVHGCAGELEALLRKLGYRVAPDGPPGYRDYRVSHPENRRVVFLGDLVDRGPRAPDVLRLVMGMVEAGRAFCVAGNHDDKWRRYLDGRDVRISHGIQDTIAQFQVQPPELQVQVHEFLESLPFHLILDGGRLVVAHAGLREDLHGETGGAARSFALFGDVAKGRDKHDLPIRRNWAANYYGHATVVHGHVAKPDVREQNNVICIDTGCVFGGHLTALKWPERQLVQVPAERVWFESPQWPGGMSRVV